MVVLEKRLDKGKAAGGVITIISYTFLFTHKGAPIKGEESNETSCLNILSMFWAFVAYHVSK